MLLARAMTRPLRDMAHAVQHFAECGEALPLPEQRSDEIGLLAQAAASAQRRIAETLAELEKNRSELAHLAHHDPLTGVPNRLLFTERAELALARAKRSGQKLAMLLIDLNDFKPVNDEKGHAAGDAVLIAVARRMQELVRETDTVARIGGDEFAILLEGLHSQQDVEPVVHKLLDAIAQPIPWLEFELCVRASIGINFYPNGADELDLLMSGADQAMYQAKASGTGYAYAITQH
jgi:diguanylate cyclase (GGDEF)-like protein